ncbi:MAG: hypothetical protein ABJC13_01070 [Acidobacteriota bacterium]
MNEKVEKHLERLEEATRRRIGLLRETVLLRFQRIPHIRAVLEFVTEALVREAGPADPSLLGESVERSEIRAVGGEFRHHQEVLGEAARRLRWRGEARAKTGARRDPADLRLAEWVEEQRREVMRLAVRFERKMGPPPGGGAAASEPVS